MIARTQLNSSSHLTYLDSEEKAWRQTAAERTPISIVAIFAKLQLKLPVCNLLLIKDL